jgi:hypothetical protein
MSVLMPIFTVCARFRERGVLRHDVPIEVLMAFVWGAFVGLFKAERGGYLKLSEAEIAAARDACWRAFFNDPPPQENRHGR